jgi:hypothetical protein
MILDTEIKLLQEILDRKKNKFLTNYINLECQNEQFDILIQRLYEITKNKTFNHVKGIEKLSIIEEIEKLVEQQRAVQSEITKIKNNIKNPSKNIMN